MEGKLLSLALKGQYDWPDYTTGAIKFIGDGRGLKMFVISLCRSGQPLDAMEQKEFLGLEEQLTITERNLVVRVTKGIEAGEPYFELFHIAFSDLVTNRFSSEKERLMKTPVYQMLDALLEPYREDPRGYSPTH